MERRSCRFFRAEAETNHDDTKHNHTGVDKKYRARKFHMSIFLEYHCHDVGAAGSGFVSHHYATSHTNHYRADDCGKHQMVAQINQAAA